MNGNNVSYETIKSLIEKTGCKLLTPKEDYKDMRTPLQLLCGNCGEKFQSTATRFKNRNITMCRKCRLLLRMKKEYDNVKEYIENKSNSGCKLLTTKEEYINKKEKLDIKCSCGNTYKCSFNQFKSQQKICCNECTKNKLRNLFKEDITYIINYINSKDTGNGCTYIDGEYLNNESSLKIKCACGNVFETTFAQFKFANKKQCNECGFKNKGQTYKIPYNEVNEFISNNNCTLLTTMNNYKNTSQQLNIRCSCGEVFQASFINFKHQGVRRCNLCYRRSIVELHTIPYNEIKKFIEIESFSECKLITPENEYINSRINIDIQCKCGEIFSTNFHEFKSGFQRTCKKCSFSISKGELKIRQFLLEHKIIFEYQYKFDDCRNINPLPFDFAIFDDKNNLICLIEYDGEQHFRPVCFGGISMEKAIENFKETKINDNIKNMYCQQNDISLFRIPYWEFNDIENILCKKLLNNERLIV